MTRIRIAFSCFFLASSSLSAAPAILTEIQLKPDPDTVRVRPFDSLFVQVFAYGELEEDGEKKVQISGGGTQFTLRSNSGSWLSKPFRFRGRKADSLVASGLQSFFGASRPDDFGVDGVRYTAPQRTGSYEIEVHSGARPLRQAEQTSFPAEPRSADPYRKLVEHHSPFLPQETWFQPKADYVSRVDFDGDSQGDNNWDAAPTGRSQAYVYKGQPQRPQHANHQLVGYDMLSAWEHLWVPGHSSRHGQNKMYDDYFAYQPYGNRSAPPYPEIAGAFLGRKRGSNKAKPFWGWKDRRTDKKKILSAGQWGLDPAYATSQNPKFPGSFSLDYVFNPFLGIDGNRAPEVRRVQTLEQPSAPEPEDFVQQEGFQQTLLKTTTPNPVRASSA